MSSSDFRIQKSKCENIILTFPDNYFHIVSPNFGYMGHIPSIYTYDGGNIIPTIAVENIPQGCKAIVLYCVDHEAKSAVGYSFIHWVTLIPITNQTKITISSIALPGQINGLNGFGQYGWGGPQPPPGTGVHRYFLMF